MDKLCSGHTSYQAEFNLSTQFKGFSSVMKKTPSLHKALRTTEGD